MTERGFPPGSFIIWARTPTTLNLWGPFATADKAAFWAAEHLQSGKGRWSIMPLWDPTMLVDA